MQSVANLAKGLGLILFGFILAWNLKCCPTCKNCPDYKGSIESVTHTVYDTVRLVKFISKPFPIAIHDTIKLPPIAVHDTIKYLKDYFSVKVFSRVLENDSNLYATLTDSVTQNGLLTGKFERKILRPVMLQTNTTMPIAQAKNKVFIGIGLNGSTNKFGASLQGALLTRHDALFGAGYDFLNKEINVAAYLKIHF